MNQELPLSERSCLPCRGEEQALSAQQVEQLLPQLDGWHLEDDHHLLRVFEFEDFVTALGHVNRVSEVAEELGHHPNISFTWGRVEIRIWTHAIDGLTEADFVLAAKIDCCTRDN